MRKGIDTNSASTRLVQSKESTDGLAPGMRLSIVRKRRHPLKNATNGRQKFFVKKTRKLRQVIGSRMFVIISAIDSRYLKFVRTVVLFFCQAAKRPI
jgi:hypothetical protein